MLRPPTRTMSASYEALLYQNGFAIAGSADRGGLSVRDVLAENIHVESATVLDDCSVMSFRKEKVLIKRSEDMPIWSIGCSIQDGGHRPQCSRLMGTTRSRVNFFTNTFRPLGFFDYDNGLRVRPSFSRTRPRSYRERRLPHVRLGKSYRVPTAPASGTATDRFGTSRHLLYEKWMRRSNFLTLLDSHAHQL